MVLGSSAGPVPGSGGARQRDRRGQLRGVSRAAARARPMLTVTADRATLNPGDFGDLHAEHRSPSIRVGGAFITTGGVGTLQALPGEGLAVNAQGLTHTAPKAASNGAVTFRFGWQAPAKPGAVDVQVAALAGNGNNALHRRLARRRRLSVGLRLHRDDLLPGSRSRRVRDPRTWGARLGCAGDPAPTGLRGNRTATATRTTRRCTRARPRSAT